MALSDRRILDEMNNGSIVIEPFNSTNLNTASYDICLGEYYYRENEDAKLSTILGGQTIFNPYDEKDVKEVWKDLSKATILGESSAYFTNMSPEDKIICIRPGETILAHTQEFIGGRNHITTMMKARSSIGRSFIEVCKCAGLGDVGYTNRWTMEITNNSRFYTIPLVVGRRIAQIIFFDTGDILDKDYVEQGSKYQTESSIEDLKQNWSPKQMLPRLYVDRDIVK